MTAYYNEHDPKAAAWLRELIKQGHIAPGVVDERSIEDIRPAELAGFTQCHFFAGIGVWSYALRRAGWPDDRPVWTGSCPCQPFSAAGKGGGFADERHLWPHWFHLIENGKRPGIPVFGEQVEGKNGLAWLDLVQADLEASGYTVWPVVIPAAGFGSPNIRHRLFFFAKRVGDSGGEGLSEQQRVTGNVCEASQTKTRQTVERGSASASRLAEPNSTRSQAQRRQPGEPEQACQSRLAQGSSVGRLADTDSSGASQFAGDLAEETRIQEEQRQSENDSDVSQRSGTDNSGRGVIGSDGLFSNRVRPNPTNGFWRSADWLGCRDGKFRPVEPGTFPLVDGAPARVVRLRGYGNAINAEVAAEFIRAVREVLSL